jgi:CheY-like chemotaxis protein
MSSGTVLIVEDQAIVAKDLSHCVGDLGYDVVDIVASGTVAVTKVAELKPDVVLMDIGLEGDRDGVSAAEAIGKRFNVPVVFVTSQTDIATITRAKRTKPAGYVVKPFEPEQIADARRAAMDRPSEQPAKRPGRPSPMAASTDPSGPSTLLVIDDQEHTQATVMSGLPRGQRVKLAGSFDAAKNILRKQGFNLILINIDLPDADGGSSIRELRQLVGAQTPIIAIAERVSPTLAAFVKESVSALLQSAQVESRLEPEVSTALGL